MRGKPEETPANSDHQTVDSNPYEKPNDNQQRQVAFQRFPDEPPPPYTDSVQSPSFDPKVQPPNPVQNDLPNNPNTPTIIYRFGRHSTEVVCPNCHTTVRTRTETSITPLTAIISILLALFCLCLALIPLCMSSCKKTIHYCPNCNYIISKVDEFE